MSFCPCNNEDEGLEVEFEFKFEFRSVGEELVPGVRLVLPNALDVLPLEAEVEGRAEDGGLVVPVPRP